MYYVPQTILYREVDGEEFAEEMAEIANTFKMIKWSFRARVNQRV